VNKHFYSVEWHHNGSPRNEVSVVAADSRREARAKFIRTRRRSIYRDELVLDYQIDSVRLSVR